MAFEVEQLFKSIDIILNQRLQNINFDKTIICTIVDDSDKKNGCYVVSDGTIKFNAYVSDTTYRKNDQVRVSVLGGDFGEKKYITGRYTSDESISPITYKSPLEAIVSITGNLVEEVKDSRNGVSSLRANGEIIEKPIWQIDLASNSEFKDLQSNGIYNTLTIKADFKTLLSHYDLVSGNYGLRLDLLIQPSLEEPTQRIRKYVTLDSSEMMGNPYAFSIYSTQAKKVDIISTGIIAEMVLWIYQSVNGDGENRRFIEKNGKEIPINTIADDILIKNIEIGFGSDLTKVSDNTLQLFTSSPAYYVYQNPTAATNKKNMELLWFNKTETNNYIGFSDGIYDLDYDEIEYLEKSNQNARLIAQAGRVDIPSDKMGLELAADLKDAKPAMIKVRDMMTGDLANVLQNLQRQIQGIESLNNELNILLDIASGPLVQQWQKADTAIKNYENIYKGVLQYAYDKQNQVESPLAWDSTWEEKDYYIDFKNAIENGVLEVQKFFNYFDTNTQSGSSLSGFRGDYDLYFYRFEKVVAAINEQLEYLNSLLNNNYEALIAYKTQTEFIEYQRTDFSEYDNKYCIYWYRHEKNYKANPDLDGNFLGDGWHKLDTIKNLGVPREYDEDGQEKIVNDNGYYAPKATGQILSRDMDNNLTEEQYIVLLFHNHVMYKSNILTFTNSEPELIPNDMLLDKRDALKIEHDAYSYDHYQIYNEFNQLRNLDDGGRIRQLKCSYDGLFRGNEALSNASIYWYLPNNDTMLTFDKRDLTLNKGFSTDADTTTEHSIPGYTYFYKKINSNEGSPVEGDRFFYYKVKPYLEKGATNNTILVKVYPEGIEDSVEGSITMTFSTFGSNGTKYTLSITPATSQSAVLGSSNSPPLNLAVKLYDSQNNQIDIIKDNQANNDGAYKFNFESWKNLPLPFDIGILPQGGDNKTPVSGLTVSLKTPQDLEVSGWPNNTPYYFGIINATVKFNIGSEDLPKDRPVDLNTLYAIPYTSSGSYYISGATSIVYNNQGTISYVSEDKYTLYNVNEIGNNPVEGQEWSMKYYDIEHNKLLGPEDASDTWSWLLNYMPVLNASNRLTPASLYIDNLNYIPVVICTVGETKDIAWVQPIIITQNRYASSTLNDWDGSLTIDEKNGTILSTAVGAGKKEDNNSFSGVLLGNIGAGMGFDSDNMSGIGLYGFNQGAQSYCLSVDGTAFFGKSGRGRIYFDGNSGTISSASYEQNKKDENKKAGMLIDLDDGFIHMLGTKKVNDYQYEANKNTQSQAEVLISTGLFNNDIDAYFKIRSEQAPKDNHYLIYVDSNEYYLQTNDYDKDGNSGVRIDLKDGSIDAYKFTIAAGTKGSNKYVYLSSEEKGESFTYVDSNKQTKTDEDIRLKLGQQFAVNSEGKLYASNADISGHVNAISGTFGGWDLHDDYLGTKIFGDGSGVFYLSQNGLEAYNTPAGGIFTKNMIYAANKFIVTSEGVMYATGAHISGGSSFTGKIYANEGGELAGWTIDANGIYQTNTNGIGVGMMSNGVPIKYDVNNTRDNYVKFYAGAIKNAQMVDVGQSPAEPFSLANFIVTDKGYLYANNAFIKGSVEATSGSLGGCIIRDGYLYSGNRVSWQPGLFDIEEAISLSGFYLTGLENGRMSIGVAYEDLDKLGFVANEIYLFEKGLFVYNLNSGGQVSSPEITQTARGLRVESDGLSFYYDSGQNLPIDRIRPKPDAIEGFTKYDYAWFRTLDKMRIEWETLKNSVSNLESKVSNLESKVSNLESRIN